MDVLLHVIGYALAFVIFLGLPLVVAILVLSMFYAVVQGFLEPFFRD